MFLEKKEKKKERGGNFYFEIYIVRLQQSVFAEIKI